MDVIFVLTAICFGCNEPPIRQEFESYTACQTAIDNGQFIAGENTSIVIFCGQERKA